MNSWLRFRFALSISPIASVLFLGGLAATAGCSTTRATGMQVGRTYPAREASCAVRYENLSFSEASAKYDQVGLVMLTGTSDEPHTWSGQTKERLEPKACALGGTVVTTNGGAESGSVMGFGTGMIQFAVWHEKQRT